MFAHACKDKRDLINEYIQSVATPNNLIYIALSFLLTKRACTFLPSLESLAHGHAVYTNSFLAAYDSTSFNPRARLTLYDLSYTRLNTRQSLRARTTIHFSSTNPFGNVILGELHSGRIKPERQDLNAVVLELAERPAPNQCKHMTSSMEHGTI